MPSFALSARPNLAETFDLIRPAFSPALLTDAMSARLRGLATRLNLTSSVGFECRLDAEDMQVDMQLGISNGAELSGICEWMLASGAQGPIADVWRRVHKWSSEWAAPKSELLDMIAYVWLEFDLPDGADAGLIPSVFAGLKPESASARPPAEEQILRSLSEAGVDETLRHTLDRCREAQLAPSYISHLGVMLGRAVRGCRVDISNLPNDSIATYLRRIEWPGNRVLAQALASHLQDFADSVVLCINVGAQVYPQIGLECFFKDPDDLNTPWAPLLDHLVDRGLCAMAKREALLEWTGITSPPRAAASWPESLIVESLLQPPNRFGVFRRRLNHVKISLGPGDRVQAKAYFGYAHEWLPRY